MARVAVPTIACFISLLCTARTDAWAFQIVEASVVLEVQEGMQMPTDAAFAEDGALFIVDGYQDRIVARHPDGRVRVIRPEGSCTLNRPLGITAYGGRLYVANTGAGTVCELDLEGRCLRSIPVPQGAEGVRSVPTDVAAEGAVIAVADRGANRIHIYIYPAFDLIMDAGEFGEPGGRLNSPYLLAMKFGRIFLTDMMNGRLVLLTDRGQFLKDIAERGVREGQFVRPKGVTVGPDGLVFVSDSTLGVVQAFDAELSYKGTLGTKGQPYRFQHPAGLAAQGNLLAVVEQKRNAVRVLRLGSP